ncbi:MFS general substrate transporter [Coemansia reversa NRRL 1564]|uniref:MFS general substrate transporter n=1 Tax=Coemansia reversa (strain ATCC 12441 / NRRL 1564) TaxID=763665 RepID=A0A2G5B1J1_COERN|nr:MFS general substrate transporter [Coemansia reversa NRRL 1564]|eukprot:PIA12866.1 MFS general substrate transporter [Coemansia reversa NRRL 1564]
MASISRRQNRRESEDSQQQDDYAADTSTDIVSDSPVKETPLPWDMLLVLLPVRLSEPVNATLILPFVYQMVADFNVAKSTKDIAFYAGILFASFSICQTFTVMYWGRLSDRIGRRPVMVVGLVGYLVSFLLFGVAKSFTWAFVARSINGLLAGNVAVMKSIMAEISDDTNRPRMMALIPLTWNVGSVAGAAVGGIFADPVHQYPGLFGNSKIFRIFPYLLPCLIGCSVTVFGLVMAIFKLKETLVKEPTLDKIASPGVTQQSSSIATESTHLIQEDTYTSVEPNKSQQRTVRELLTPVVIRTMATNAVVCLGISMAEQVYPIFAASDPVDGGLGFASRSIGISLAIAGVAVLYLQLVTYPRLERKYGALNCYRTGQKFLIPAYLAMPFLSFLATNADKTIVGHDNEIEALSWFSLPLQESALWILLVVVMLLRTTGTVLAFTSINILTVNLAPTKADLGFMNGLQQVALCVTRVAGPIAAGSVFSWSIKHTFPYPFNSHFVWVLCAALTVMSLQMTSKIPESVNTFLPGQDNSTTETEVEA